MLNYSLYNDLGDDERRSFDLFNDACLGYVGHPWFHETPDTCLQEAYVEFCEKSEAKDGIAFFNAYQKALKEHDYDITRQ